MRPIKLLVLSAIVASSVAPRIQAQGALVRVSHDGASGRSQLTGTLVATSADSLWIRPEGARSAAAPVAIARGSVREFERGDLLGAHRMVGAGLGLFAGTLIGGAIGASTACKQCDGMGELAVLGGAVSGGLIGVLTGTVIGSLIPHYEWQRGDVPQRASVTVGSKGEMQVGASLRF
jgi:Zn-dependent protease